MIEVDLLETEGPVKRQSGGRRLEVDKLGGVQGDQAGGQGPGVPLAARGPRRGDPVNPRRAVELGAEPCPRGNSIIPEIKDMYLQEVQVSGEIFGQVAEERRPLRRSRPEAFREEIRPIP